MEDIIRTGQLLLMDFGIKLLVALVILIIGRWIAKLIARVGRRLMERSKIEDTVVSFTGNLIYYAILTFVVLAAIAQLGVETTSFVVVLGAAGLAIGLSLQGSLGNFASGVLLIIFRPFKLGDYIEAAGMAGTADEIQIFTTTLRTPDNKKVIIPNSNVTGGPITNYSAHESRRVDLIAGISYSDDIDKARQVLTEVLANDERVLKDPEPTIGVVEMGDSSVNFVVRPWVKTSDYWPSYFALTEAIKKGFDAAGITIPFPQRDVHLYQQSVVSSQ